MGGVDGPAIEEHRRAGTRLPAAVEQAIAKTCADYERWLDAHHAAARGYVDALISPLDTRALLAFALEAACASGRRVRRCQLDEPFDLPPDVPPLVTEPTEVPPTVPAPGAAGRGRLGGLSPPQD